MSSNVLLAPVARSRTLVCGPPPGILLIGECNPGSIARPDGPVKVSLRDAHWSADFLVPFGRWIDTHNPKAKWPGRR